MKDSPEVSEAPRPRVAEAPTSRRIGRRGFISAVTGFAAAALAYGVGKTFLVDSAEHGNNQDLSPKNNARETSPVQMRKEVFSVFANNGRLKVEQSEFFGKDSKTGETESLPNYPESIESKRADQEEGLKEASVFLAEHFNEDFTLKIQKHLDDASTYLSMSKTIQFSDQAGEPTRKAFGFRILEKQSQEEDSKGVESEPKVLGSLYIDNIGDENTYDRISIATFRINKAGEIVPSDAEDDTTSLDGAIDANDIVEIVEQKVLKAPYPNRSLWVERDRSMTIDLKNEPFDYLGPKKSGDVLYKIDTDLTVIIDEKVKK